MRTGLGTARRRRARLRIVLFPGHLWADVYCSRDRGRSSFGRRRASRSGMCQSRVPRLNFRTLTLFLPQSPAMPPPSRYATLCVACGPDWDIASFADRPAAMVIPGRVWADVWCSRDRGRSSFGRRRASRSGICQSRVPRLAVQQFSYITIPPLAIPGDAPALAVRDALRRMRTGLGILRRLWIGLQQWRFLVASRPTFGAHAIVAAPRSGDAEHRDPGFAKVAFLDSIFAPYHSFSPNPRRCARPPGTRRSASHAGVSVPNLENGAARPPTAIVPRHPPRMV